MFNWSAFGSIAASQDIYINGKGIPKSLNE